MLNVVKLNVVMLNVVMLNVIMLNAVILNVIMLNVIMLNAVMLIVVALLRRIQTWPDIPPDGQHGISTKDISSTTLNSFAYHYSCSNIAIQKLRHTSQSPRRSDCR